MIRSVFAALVLATLSPAALAVNGQITNLDLAVKFGGSAGTDFLDASGNYVQGQGGNGINLPSEAVVVSFDGGRFIQALPSNSFTAISGGWRYLAPTGSSGVTLLKIMNNGTFDLDIRKSDFTGTKPQQMGALSITVGDDTFSAIPNSMPVGRVSGPSTAQANQPLSLFASSSSDFNGDACAAQQNSFRFLRIA